MGREIILYGAAMCSDCQKLKDYMQAEGIEHELRDIRENPEFAKEVEENTGKLGVPYVVIDGEWIRGYPLDGAFSEDFARGLFEN